MAIEKGYVKIVQLLLERENININEKSISKKGEDGEGKTPLFLAVEKANTEIINLLLSKPEININAKSYHTEKEETALHLSVKNQNLDIIKLLLKSKGINASAEDDQGRKPIELTSNVEIKRLF